METPQFTFTLPDITRYSADFRGFLEKVRYLAECYLAAEFDAGCVLGPDRDVCAGQSGAGRPPQLVGGHWTIVLFSNFDIDIPSIYSVFIIHNIFGEE